MEDKDDKQTDGWRGKVYGSVWNVACEKVYIGMCRWRLTDIDKERFKVLKEGYEIKGRVRV